MRKHISTLVLLTILFCNVTIAQHKNQFVKSCDIINAAYQLCDSNWFDKAIDTLKTVDKSDTGYVLALTELSYCYMKAKKYPEALQTVNKALNYPSAYQLRLAMIKGITYDEQGYPDSSILVYTNSLKKYHYSYLIYYNMGITYSNQKKYEKAVKAFQQSIIYNPFHTSSHIALGSLMARMGQYTHAMLCFETYLVIEPNALRSNANLIFLNNMTNNVVNKESETIAPVIDNKTFEDIDQLIKSGIALNSGYKAKIKFDAPVAKQTQLLFESLQYKSNTGDFWMDYYVPMFTKTKDAGYMEDFIYTILTSAPDKTIAEQLKKRAKNIKEMNSILANHLISFYQKQKISIDGKEEIIDFHLNDNNNLLSFGNYSDDHKTRIGHWKFFHNNGEPDEEGDFINGKAEGKWTSYDDNGTVSGTKTYANGQLQGDFMGYYSNGNLKYKAIYNHGEVQGDVTYYYDCTTISSVLHFDKDKKNGLQKVFYKNSAIKEEYYCTNDSLDGDNKTYYPSGQIKSFYRYKTGKLHGAGTDYYRNGKPSYRGEYTNSKRDGKYETYFQNGSIHVSGNYKNDKQTGVWKEFNNLGTLIDSSFCNSKGNFEGENKIWDNDGKLHFIYTYENDALKEVKYFDKNGKITGNTKLTNKTTSLNGYYPDGQLFFNGTYTNYKPDGTWNYYFKSGKKSAVKNFKEGLLHGPYTSFFPSGKKEIEINYTNDEEDGYYKKYYTNGNLLEFGWYVDGKQEGKWNYNHPDGRLEKTVFFLNNELNGYFEDYAPDSKLQMSTCFKNGIAVSLSEFDTLGIRFSHTDFDGKQDYCLHFPDGKIRARWIYSCNQFNSNYTLLDRNGNQLAACSYNNGQKEGPYVDYYEPGKKDSEGSFEEGEQAGLWKYYYKNNKLKQKGNFLNDNKDSIWIKYYANGRIKSEVKYKNGEMIDTAKYFDSFGEFMYSMVYDSYGVISYQYRGPEGFVSKKIDSKDSGVITTYYKNGKVSSEQTYKEGTIQGKQILYYSNGNRYLEFNQTSDYVFDGKYSEYFENGNAKYIQNYLLGLNHGTNLYFREDGKPDHSEEYRYGDKHGSIIKFDEKGNKLEVKKYWGDIPLN